MSIQYRQESRSFVQDGSAHTCGDATEPTDEQWISNERRETAGRFQWISFAGR
jgi:hypothetical protein